jgi:hypothetical protein
MNLPYFIKNIPARTVYLFKNLNDGGIFTLWVFVILLVSSLLWPLTANIRTRSTILAANNALAGIGDYRKLTKHIPIWGVSGTAVQAGEWFITDDGNLAVIWTLPVDGILSPFLTLFNREKDVDKTVPLSKTAEYFALRVPGGVPELFSNRITRAARLIEVM